MRRIRVVHIINSFEYGGAEAMLCNLLLRTDQQRFEPHVVSLIDDLTVAEPIVDAGLPLTVIGLNRRRPNLGAMWRLVRHLRALKPDIVHTWMDHSNLIGGLAAKLAGVPEIVWGIHHSDHVKALTKRSTLLTVWASAKLSHRLPTRIVFCSEHSQRLYAKRGFDSSRCCVVPNGFDTSRFKPDAQARQRIRAQSALRDDNTVLGLVARYDPLKDHATFLRAAELLLQTHPHVRFLLCGAGVETSNAQLIAHLASPALREACRLLGPRTDVEQIYAALDIATSSSISEAFPLAIGEAMACGVPCVATDVGDSRLIVGETGRIVPPRDPAAIAAAWRELLELDRAARCDLGSAARKRIVQLFELETFTRRFEQLYGELHSSAAPDASAEYSTDEVVTAN
jgi:glycosyltransferase involved in cell wall biosynthesis